MTELVLTLCCRCYHCVMLARFIPVIAVVLH